MSAPRTKRRDKWRTTKKGCWVMSIGSRGQRVTLFQTTKDGSFYGGMYRDGRMVRRSLGTRDRVEAERLGRELYASRLAGVAPTRVTKLKLGELAKAYVGECAKFARNKDSTKRDARGRIAVLLAHFGEHREVRSLSGNDIDHYASKRMLGGIRYGPQKTTEPVRQRSVQADVKLLKAMTSWATTRTNDNGTRWLDIDPLHGVRVEGERDVVRSVATQARYEATLNAIRRRQDRYEEEARTLTSVMDRARAHRRWLSWVRAELALYLLKTTGRRASSVLGLRWDDFDFAAGKILWRAELDKKKRSARIPYPEDLFGEVRRLRARLSSVAGLVFPRLADAELPVPTKVLAEQVLKAESDAGLSKLAGSTLHAYRRMWGSRRVGTDLKARMVAGGWSDPGTLLTCYTHPDDDDLLAVTAEPPERRKLA